jgi:hypothetical protein
MVGRNLLAMLVLQRREEPGRHASTGCWDASREVRWLLVEALRERGPGGSGVRDRMKVYMSRMTTTASVWSAARRRRIAVARWEDSNFS